MNDFCSHISEVYHFITTSCRGNVFRNDARKSNFLGKHLLGDFELISMYRKKAEREKMLD